MPVVKIHGSAAIPAALAAQVGGHAGRVRQFNESSTTFRNGIAGREMNLREGQFKYDRDRDTLLDGIMQARQRAMAAETGMNPDLDPSDMLALQRDQRAQADLGAKRGAAKTALQHAYTNGIFGDPNSFDALGALQQLGPLADQDPDTVLRTVGERTMGHVAQKYENDQRDAAAKDLAAIAGKYNDDRRAFVETLAMGVGGGWVKPADAYRAIGDLIEQDRSQTGRMDLMERENASRSGMMEREYQLRGQLQDRENTAKADPVQMRSTMAPRLKAAIMAQSPRAKPEVVDGLVEQWVLTGRMEDRPTVSMSGQERETSVLNSEEYKIQKEIVEDLRSHYNAVRYTDDGPKVKEELDLEAAKLKDMLRSKSPSSAGAAGDSAAAPDELSRAAQEFMRRNGRRPQRQDAAEIEQLVRDARTQTR